MHRRLGAGRPLLVRAHRPLVGGEAELRRRPQGLPHQPRGRHRPAHRRDHPVLRRRPDASTSSTINTLANDGDDQPHRCCSSASLLPDRRRDVEVGPVHPAHLAARRHGRPHAGVGADPRRHHGRGRHLHGRPPLRACSSRASSIGTARRSTCSPSIGARHRAVRRRCLAFVQNDIKKVLAYSTVSQLGYMVMALGVGAWTAAHLPPLHPRLLQGLPVPRLRLGQPRRPLRFDMKKDMGGLRKYMPNTFWTFMIGTGRAHRHLPARRLLVEGRDPRRRPPARRRRRLQALHGHGPHRRLHDRGLHDPGIWYTFYGESRGARPTARARTRPAPASPSRSSSWPSARSSPASPTCPTKALRHRRARRRSRCASSTSSSRPAPTSRAPQHASATPSSTPGSPSVSTVIGAHRRSALAYLWYWQGPGPARPHRAQQASPAPATRCSRTSTTSTASTPTSSSASSRARSPRPPTGSTRTSSTASSTAPATSPVKAGEFVYDNIDQGVVDGVVNGSGRRRRGHRRGRCARSRPARSSSTPPVCSSAAPILAAVFVLVVQLRTREIETMNDLPQRLGPHRRRVPAPGGRAGDAGDPQGGGDRSTRWSPWSPALVVFAVGVALLFDFDYDQTGELQFVDRQDVDRGHQQPLHRGHRRHLAAAARPHRAHRAAGHHLLVEPLPRAAQPQGVPRS